MPDVILHHYAASPFTQKALKMLGIKGIEWRSVETPMIAPKPDLTPLTGGYRGTPVLQLGADIYVDNARILAALDTRYPTPAISNDALALTDAALCTWGDGFFEAGLHMAIHEYAAHWDADFSKDREAVFERLSFDQVKARYEHACGLLRANAALIDSQLSDGRAFLTGDVIGMADLHAWPVLWFTRNMPDTNPLLNDLPHLPAWEQRVNAVGEGTRLDLGAEAALADASSAQPLGDTTVAGNDPLAGLAGRAVSVAAMPSNRGVSVGTLVGLTSREIVIALDQPP